MIKTFCINQNETVQIGGSTFVHAKTDKRGNTCVYVDSGGQSVRVIKGDASPIKASWTEANRAAEGLLKSA